MHPLPVSLCLLLLASVDAQQAVDRSYDLRPLTAPLPGVVGKYETPHLLLPIGPVLGARNEENLSDGGRLYVEPVSASWLAPDQLVSDRLAAFWSAERGVGELVDGRLELRAPESVHAQVQDMLSLMMAIRQQTRRLTLFELPASASSNAGALLTAEEVAALLRQSPPVRATDATVALDVPWLWESGRSVRYVRDYDVEVAEKSSISDPKLDVFFVGARLGLCLTPMIDGRCLLRLGWLTAEESGPLAPSQLPGNGLGAIHLPAVELLEITATAAVPPGGGVLLCGDRARRSWLLRVAGSTSPSPQFGAATVLPLGGLAVQPLGAARARELDLVERPEEDRISRRGRNPVPDGLLALDRLIGGRLGDEPERAQAFGSHVVLAAPAAARAAAEEALRRQAEGVQTTSLTFRVGVVDNALALGHLAGGVSAERLAASLPTEAAITTLAGHGFGLSLGREQSFVADYEVEIASKAAAANPVVKIAFDGFRLQGVLQRTPGQVPQLDLRLQWSEVSPLAALDLANQDLGNVGTPVSAWTDVEQSVDVRGNEWQVVTLQPDPAAAADRSLVLMVRAQ